MPGRPRRNGDVILYAGGSILIRVLQGFFVIRQLLRLRRQRSAHQVHGHLDMSEQCEAI